MKLSDLTNTLAFALKGLGVCRDGKIVYKMLEDGFYIAIWLQRSNHTLDPACYVNLHLSHTDLREINRNGEVVRPSFPTLGELWSIRINEIEGFSDWHSVPLVSDNVARFVTALSNGFMHRVIPHYEKVKASYYDKYSDQALERLVQRNPNVIQRIVHRGSLLHAWGHFELAIRMYTYCFSFGANWAERGAQVLIDLCEKRQLPK